MNCNRVILALATGGWIGRWRARRHIRRCATCASEYTELQRGIADLSAVDPLSQHERRLWMGTCEGNSASKPIASRMKRRPTFAAAMVLVAIGLYGAWKRYAPQPLGISDPRVSVVDPWRIKQATVRDLDGIGAGVAALLRELDDLRQEADLLDARRDADRLQLLLHPRTASK